MIEQFAEDVDDGLSQSQKKLSSKYFYDEKGDALFVEIMGLEEYYLTRAEMQIFREQTHSIIEAFQLDRSEYFELIELGAGDGSKTQHLLQALLAEDYQFDYIPIDISHNALDLLQQNLSKDLPQLSVKTKQGDYFENLESLKDSHHPKVVLFLGSNIGNMKDAIATEFIYHLGDNLSPDDKLLIGADLIKSADIVIPAYDDGKGITSDFNLNLLTRINNELGGNFDLENFDHVCEYTEEEGIARSYLKSLRDQTVTIDATGKTYEFAADEKINTEVSRKYNDKILNKILSKTDFKIIKRLTDKQHYFADYILLRG